MSMKSNCQTMELLILIFLKVFILITADARELFKIYSKKTFFVIKEFIENIMKSVLKYFK